MRMKKLLLCVPALFLFIFSFAQIHSVDSLQRLLFQLKDSARIDCLNAISYSYTEAENKDTANYYADLAWNEAKLSGYINGMAVSLTRKARIEKHFNDDFVKVETFARRSLEWYDKTSNKTGIYDTWGILAFAHQAQSHFDE